MNIIKTYRKHLISITFRSFSKSAMFICFISSFVFADMLNGQVISNNGASITINPLTTVTSKDFLVSSSGTVKNDGVIDLSGSYSSTGLTSGDGNYNIAEDWTHNGGGFDPHFSTVYFDGTGVQNITNDNGEVFNNLTIVNRGTGPIKLKNDAIVNGVLTITAGTLDLNGHKLTIASTGSIACTDSGRVFGPAGSEFVINSTSSTYLPQGDYYHVTISTPSAATITLCGNVTVAGNLTINSGTLQLADKNLTATGPTMVSGAIKDNNVNGTDLFAGEVTINPGGIWDFSSGNSNVEFRDGLIFNGTTFNSGTGIYAFTTNSQSIDATTPLIFRGAVNISENVTFNTDVSVLGNLTVANSAVLAFGAFSSFILDVTGTFNATNGTLDMANGLNINHVLKLRGQTNSCNLLLTDDQSVIEYLGAEGQQVFASPNYRNITFGGTGAKILQGDVSMSGSNMFMSADVKTGSYTLYLSNSGVGVNRTAGAVLGNLKRRVAATSVNYLFPVGDSALYNPLVVNFSNLNTGDYLVSYKKGNIGGSGLPLNDDGNEVYELDTAGYWQTQASASLTTTNYSLKLTTHGFLSDSSSRIIRNEGGVLFADGAHGGFTAPDITRDSLSGILNSAFTSFGIGKGRPHIVTSPHDSSVCQGLNASFAVVATGQGTLTYQWQVKAKNGSSFTGITNGGLYSNATTNVLSITGVTLALDSNQYRCVVTDAEGHPNTSGTATIIVYPTPVISLSQTSDTICNTTSAVIVPTSTVPGSTYNWTFVSDTGIAGAVAGSGLSIVNTLTNSNDDSAKVIYTITPISSFGCIGLSKNDTIWVEPTAKVVPVASNDTICDNTLTAIRLTSPTLPTRAVKFRYEVVAPASVTVTSGTATNLDKNAVIKDRLDNTGNSVQLVKFVITPYTREAYGNAEKCTGITDTAYVWVNPTPYLTASVTDTILCDSTILNITVNDNNGPVIQNKYYQLITTYNSGQLKGVQPSGEYISGLDIVDTIINSSNAVQKVTYNFTPRISDAYGNYCSAGNDTTITIYINPTSRIQLFKSDTLYCDSSTVQFGLVSKNLQIIGDKYYYIQTSYDSSKVSVTGYTNGYAPVANFEHQIINKTNQLQTVKYIIHPVIRNPRLVDTTEYCSQSVDTIFTLSILPSLKAELSPKIYAGGWNVRCNGESNGEINLTLSGGMRVLSMDQDSAAYEWSNNLFTRNIKNLMIGSYSVKVTDTHGCKAYADTTLFQPAKLIVDYNILLQDSCTSKGKGKMFAYGIGGTKPYAYEWQYGNDRRVYSDTIANCIEGEYLVILTDANGCKSNEFAYMTSGEDITPQFEKSQFGNYNISCTDYSNGFFNLLGQWYNYHLELNETVNDTDRFVKSCDNCVGFSGLQEGIYTITLSVGNCQGFYTDTLKEPELVTINKNISQYYNGLYNLSCDNSLDGSIKINASNGHGNYHYNWTSTNSTSFTDTSFINNLDSGTYYLHLVDSSDYVFGAKMSACHYYDTISVTKPSALALDTILSNYKGYNIACYDSSSGSIEALVTGGFGDYTYHWSKPGLSKIFPDTNKIKGLDVGTYNLVVNYGNNCSGSWNIILTQPDSISNVPVLSDYNGYHVSCFDKNNGFVTTNLSGGVGQYTYKWINSTSKLFTTNKDLTNAVAGKYRLEARDANNCLYTWKYELTQPQELITLTEGRDITCKSQNDGKAFISQVNGGIIPYSFEWSTSSTDTVDSITNLSPGTYFVVVKDKNQCRDTAYVDITEPNALFVNIKVDTNYHGRQISCFGMSDGSLQAVVAGGRRPYTYQWMSLDANSNLNFSNINDSVLTGLPIGRYGLTVVDASLCSNNDIDTITQPDSLQLNILVNNLSCFNENNGKLTAVVRGGTIPYEYNWDNGAKSDIAEDLREGSYSINVYDANNCNISKGAKVIQPDSLRVLNYKSNPYCPATFDGAIVLRTFGGTKPYAINWNNGMEGDSIGDLMIGKYVFTLSDSNNCQLIDTIVLKSRNNACLDIPKAFTPNSDGKNDRWNILAGDPRNPQPLSALYSNCVIEIYNRWGTIIYKSDRGYGKEWDGTYKGRELPMDSYYYTIDLGDGSEKTIGIVSIIR